MAEARRSSEDRQVELVDAALRCIATKGIAALSTRSLAESVGLSSGAIFRHFPSLDALLEAVVARVEALLEATYPAADLPPLQRLERFVEARSQTVGGQLGLHRLVTSEQFHLALPAPSAKRLATAVRKSRAFVVERLREAQADGTVRDDLAPALLAPIVMGTVQAIVLTGSAPPSEGADPQAIRAALFTLLRPPARPKRSR